MDQAPEAAELGAAETGGGYVVTIGELPPGEAGPPFHAHPHADEAVYVIEGEATFRRGDRELPLGPGSFVFVPRGTPHTAWNSGEGTVRGLVVISPGDAEHVLEPVDEG